MYHQLLRILKVVISWNITNIPKPVISRWKSKNLDSHETWAFSPCMNSQLFQTEKRYHNVFSTFFIWFAVHIQPFFNSTNGLNIWTVRCLSHCMECSFKSNRKLNHDILNSLTKSKLPGHCRFPLTNPHSVESVDFVPPSILQYDNRIISD